MCFQRRCPDEQFDDWCEELLVIAERLQTPEMKAIAKSAWMATFDPENPTETFDDWWEANGPGQDVSEDTREAMMEVAEYAYWRALDAAVDC